jgi:hypothetical protein
MWMVVIVHHMGGKDMCVGSSVITFRGGVKSKHTHYMGRVKGCAHRAWLMQTARQYFVWQASGVRKGAYLFT